MTNLREVEVNNFPLSAFGDFRTIELHPIYQQSFEYTVSNTELNKNTVVAGGTVTQDKAMAVITSSTTTGSSALFQTERHGKYRAGFGGLLRFTTLFTTGVAATEQYAGLADETGSSAAFLNGYMIGFDGDTFGFHRFSNDTKHTMKISDWDDSLDGSGASGATIDLTKINVWEIRFGYLGGDDITVWRKRGGKNSFDLVNTEIYPNKHTEPSVYNPNFHGTFWVNNKATTSNLILKSASLGYFVEGHTEYNEIHQPQFSTGEQTKATVTTEVPILTIRNKVLYAGKNNFIDIILEIISASIQASSTNNLGKVRLIRNAVLTGESFVDINTTDSIVDLDTSATSFTGGKELLTEPFAGKNDKASQGVLPLKIILSHGESITIAGSSVNSATINAAMLWKELF